MFWHAPIWGRTGASRDSEIRQRGLAHPTRRQNLWPPPPLQCPAGCGPTAPPAPLLPIQYFHRVGFSRAPNYQAGPPINPSYDAPAIRGAAGKHTCEGWGRHGIQLEPMPAPRSTRIPDDSALKARHWRTRREAIPPAPLGPATHNMWGGGTEACRVIGGSAAAREQWVVPQTACFKDRPPPTKNGSKFYPSSSGRILSGKNPPRGDIRATARSRESRG